MIRQISGVFVSVLLVSLSGCVLNGQTVTLEPQVRISATGIGEGRTVAVTIKDGRPDQRYGTRVAPGSPAYGLGAISSAPDQDERVLSVINQMLQKQGFVVKEGDPETQLTLVAELRELRYSMYNRVLSLGVHVDGVLHVIATNDHRRYEQSYRANIERTVLVTPTAAGNAELINEVASGLLQKMADDKELFKFLAE